MAKPKKPAKRKPSKPVKRKPSKLQRQIEEAYYLAEEAARQELIESIKEAKRARAKAVREAAKAERKAIKEAEEAYQLAEEQARVATIEAAKDYLLKVKLKPKAKPTKVKPTETRKGPWKPVKRKIPKRFIPKPVAKGLIDTASEEMNKTVSDAITKLRQVCEANDIDAIDRVFTNADGSIDAELRIMTDNVKPSSLRNLLTWLEPKHKPIPSTWVSVGYMIAPDTVEQKSGKLVSRKTGLPMRGGKGALFFQSQYVNAYDWPKVLLTGKKMQSDTEKWDKKARVEGFSIRIHWNPRAERPTREG